MKGYFLPTIAAAGMILAAGSAMAADSLATISNIQSPVMVNQGDAYVPAREGMTLGNGDQLLVMQGGAALVNYASGCELKLGGNEILRIAATDACSAPSVAATNAQVAPPPSSPGAGGGSGAGSAGIDLGLVATLAAVSYATYEIADDEDLPPISR
ncbi:hypothetical protein Q6D67_11720 [Haliea sp. E1-2-M8]|uniref:hypothetical protein n=1 Tax=Haliea sp. E1-2-M8 TaxID=3064706 RepID=UPI002724333F|nr:hypothetical protein [Haliea sp. E1-2-M8]MDO8862370.1 hypothetical protein [Haliea sp. E1-2-M8]